MTTWRIARRGVMAAFAGLALAACGQGGDKAGDTAEAPKAAAPTVAADGDYTIGWTIYAGWVPWPYAQQSGIVKKWADKYGVKINVVQINDYVESLNQYTAGKLDAVTATNMDALTIPAAAGKDTTMLIVGDYSNGNDGLVLKGAGSLAQLKGQTVNLVELSVSHYLLARAIEKAGLRMADVKTVNTSDADIVAAFASPDTKAVAAWNPQLAEIKAQPGATEVFNSSEIPAEILDGLLVHSDLVKADPNLAKALTGIWYETVALMTANTPEGAAAREAMGRISGTDRAGFEAQLKTTYLYAQPQAAAAFVKSPQLQQSMERVRQFSFANGLFGQGARTVDDIGIAFPGAVTQGSTSNVKLRFDATYADMAAQGQL